MTPFWTGLLRKLRHRGGPLVRWVFSVTAAAYNLDRLRTLIMAPAQCAAAIRTMSN